MESGFSTPSGNEMRVSTTGKIGNYLIYATGVMDAQAFLVVKATGGALMKAITVAELLKRRHAGLHQITEVETVQFSDKEPRTSEEGKPVSDKRWKASITITLSKNVLDTTHVGYQAPLPPSEGDVPVFRPPQRRPAEASRAPRVFDAQERRRPVGTNAPRHERERQPPFRESRNQRQPFPGGDHFGGERAVSFRQPRGERVGSARFAGVPERRGADEYAERRVPFGGAAAASGNRPSSAFGERGVRPFAERREEWQPKATGERTRFGGDARTAVTGLREGERSGRRPEMGAFDNPIWARRREDPNQAGFGSSGFGGENTNTNSRFASRRY